MNILIAKLGATGDVVRTTPLLRRLNGQLNWVTAAKNVPLLEGIRPNVKCVSWEQRDQFSNVKYDLVINLEDTLDVAEYVNSLDCKQIFGAYADASNNLKYTDDSRRWFDLSLLSVYGREKADQLKYQNRSTYQDLIFNGLGFKFAGEKYVMPRSTETGLSGDVAIAAESGPVWPMKSWDHYGRLKQELEGRGLTVNLLPKRATLLEHLHDSGSHRVLVGGDSLPMHLAMGSDVRCVSLFNCTSPWEIHDYGIQTKLISPLLGEFFYKRDKNPRATTAIPFETVLDAVLAQLEASEPARVTAAN